MLPVIVALLLAAGAVGLIAGGPADSASANVGLNTPHGALVSEVPDQPWPRVLGTPQYFDLTEQFDLEVWRDREVLSATSVQGQMLIGGNFHEIEDVDGNIVESKYLAAFDRNTGELFNSLVSVDREVLAIHDAQDGVHAYIAGRFNVVGGTNHRKLARINMITGQVDPNFSFTADAAVSSVDVSDGRLFIGGFFTTINGEQVGDVAEIDPQTGDLIDAFNFTFEGVDARGTFTQFSAGSVKHVELTPNGDTLVVVHRASTVDGEKRSGYALFDVSDPTAPTLLPSHSNTFFAWPNCAGGALPTNASVSPDGTYFVMTTTVHDLPPCHDAAIAFAIDGGVDADPLWAHQMRDSPFGVGISDVAVYVGGHFCRIDEGPSQTMVDGDDTAFCTGSLPDKYTDGAWRFQLAALHPVDGTPLDWDPGANSFSGAQFLFAINDGLLIGHDGSEVGGVNVGAFTMLEVDPNATVPPLVPVDPVDPVEPVDPVDPVEPEALPVLCQGRVATIVGTDGDDTLIGTGQTDVIAGLDGNDTIRGLDGNDFICGGDGNDLLLGGVGHDLLSGGAGRDVLRGELGRDILLGEGDRDWLNGGSGADLLDGGLRGDRIVGGASHDILIGSTGQDRMFGGPGNDDLRGNAGDDRLVGDAGIDSLNGGGGIDSCTQANGGTVTRCE